MKKILMIFLLCITLVNDTFGAYIFIPMDGTQNNHLKAYGMTYWVLTQEVEVDWLLNYKGGSFMVKHHQLIENECVIRGISYKIISDAEANSILNEIASPASNMDVMKLEKHPKIAVYSPKSKQPWDDAVTLVLTYAEIPYETIFDDEIIDNQLPKYDWLHLHHEDFTGQYGKFYRTYHSFPWYQKQQHEYEQSAAKHGFSKVSQLKLEIAKKIKSYVVSGGFLFAMCSATDTYDIALAGEGIDMIERIYDRDGADPAAQSKLDFSKTFAFENFILERDPLRYEYANIDNQINEREGITEGNDFFSLFDFSAKWDPIPTMLTQNHTKIVHGFMGQTTAFKSNLIKNDVVIMGETASIKEAKYIHGVIGKGFWTFYGGHDPEDYQHFVSEEPTDLSLHPNSPGYRLILNNILFPAAKKKKQKT